MYCVKKITEDMYWIGASDRRLELFENVYPIPKGVSYNSYVILDEKTVLLDTVDHSVCSQFLENLYNQEPPVSELRRRLHRPPIHCSSTRRASGTRRASSSTTAMSSTGSMATRSSNSKPGRTTGSPASTAANGRPHPNTALRAAV